MVRKSPRRKPRPTPSNSGADGQRRETGWHRKRSLPASAPSGEISIDLGGKKPGRGAYLCPNPDCLTKAKKKKALERCFEQPVPAEVYEALAAQLAEAAKEAAANGKEE